jgi:hypothetical protein
MIKTRPDTIEPIDGKRVWRRADVEDKTDWIQRVSPEVCADLHDAVADAKRRGRDFSNLDFEVYDYASLSALADDVRAALRHGYGFYLLKGLPFDGIPIDDLKMMMQVLGHHIGLVGPQFEKPRWIGEVTDTGPGKKHFYYHRGGPLPMHMDPVDVVGLWCVRAAKRGGESGISSSMALHNEILRTRPDLVEILYRGYRYIKVHDAKNRDQGRLTDHYCPIFADIGGETICSFLPSVIEMAAEEGLVKLSPLETEALEYFKELAGSTEFRFDMHFEPGDLQFLNNRAILHNRLDYEDYPEPERRRLLLRLWLTMPGWRKYPPHIPHTDVELNTEPA